MGFVFEPGQFEIRLTMHLGGDSLDSRRPDATLAEQARSGAAGA
jgi:hypothetical protein